MPAAPAADKTGRDAPRHSYGPRPLGALVPALLKPVFAKHPAATAQVIADWTLIVGAAMAATTRPRRLSGGTLVVGCAGPVALELQHVGDVLIGRINRHLGHVVVQRLRIVQESIAPPAAPPPPPSVRPKDRAAVEQALGDFAPGPLRDALAGLGLAVRQGLTGRRG